jgi:hypothetical protein
MKLFCFGELITPETYQDPLEKTEKNLFVTTKGAEAEPSTITKAQRSEPKQKHVHHEQGVGHFKG